LNFYSIS